MKSFAALSLILASAFLLIGCASGTGGKDYSREQTRIVLDVQMGIVESGARSEH